MAKSRYEMFLLVPSCPAVRAPCTDSELLKINANIAKSIVEVQNALRGR